MTNARIVVEPATMRRTAGGRVTGSIWVDLESKQFPIQGWNDFVVVVLCWWAGAVARLLRRETDQELVNCMDAPYRVRIVTHERGWILTLLDGRTSEAGIEVGRALAALPVLGQSIVDGADLVLAECHRRNWWSTNARALADLQTKLRGTLFND
ncbi:MAG: hypothetical protein C5B57_07210 [Blastocatellia bacterium]|nr:MAG: hypothetical protein C5B57_07210 [Blastocatellia bacterium]